MKLDQDSQKARTIKIIEVLRVATKGMIRPASESIVAEYGRDPFLVLISCILSLRTKDLVSLPASQRLFKLAKEPHAMVRLSFDQIQKAIYPVGFYRQKAIQIHDICNTLIEQFDGKVPRNEADLLSLKGVGRKTMNLVLAEGFGIPAICVDTHVHRISNRLGLVATNTPEETEAALREVLPQKYWIEYTRLIIMWGQNVCVSISPFCSTCPIAGLCPQVGVTKRR
jgi:endonuclease-3